MRIHFVGSATSLRELDKQLIVSVLQAHWMAHVHALVAGGATPEEADAAAVRAVQKHADEVFSGVTIDVLA